MQATESKSLIETKSLLAKLMAMENLAIEQRAVPTAMFDVNNRILTIPVLDDKISSELYDLFVGHEVAHALWTPIDGLIKAYKEKVSKGVANVVEDARIERMIKSKYPGLRNSFTKGYRELFEKNFFNTEGYDINDMNFIDRTNLYFKSGATLGIVFSPEERELIDAVSSTVTYDDVIEVSKRIASLMREQHEKQKDSQDDSEDSEDSEDELEGLEGFDFDDYSNDDIESDYDNESDSDEDSEDSDEDSDKEDGIESGDDEEADESESESGEGDISSSSANENKSRNQKPKKSTEFKEDEIRSHTDEALKENERQLFAANSSDMVYANVPKFDLDKHIVDHKEIYKKYKEDTDSEFSIDRVGFQKIRKDTSKIVSYLAKEFELRKNADQLKRASVSKTGDLNMSKIFSYQFNEDIFKKITIVPNGKSHGLVLFLDWSGSMNGHMSNTIKQLIAIVMFCKKVNIPFEVYAFSEKGPREYFRPEPKSGDLVAEAFILLNILSSRMSAGEFSFAASALVYISNPRSFVPYWFQLGSTPLNECIMAAMDLIPAFQSRYKLQVVNTVFLTDGEANVTNAVHQYDPTYQKMGTQWISSKNLVVRDPVTRHEVRVKSGHRVSTGLIKLLKLRTNCNVVGFYLLSARELSREMYNWFPYRGQGVLSSQLRAKFRKEKYLVVKSAGFDEYYLMLSEDRRYISSDEDEEFEIESGATTRKFVSAFAKYTSGRLANRVVLNRFVGMIA